MLLHHVVLFVSDVEASLAFYRDGLGLAVLSDDEYDGDWPTLLGVTGGRLRAVVLGDPERPKVGQVELLSMIEPVPPGAGAAAPTTGTVALSFHADIDTVLPALVDRGGTDARRTALGHGHPVGSVRDPDGVLVEIIHRPPR